MEPTAPPVHLSGMKSFLTSLDLVQVRIIEAVETASTRTAEEQRILLAGLLAAAFEAHQTQTANA